MNKELILCQINSLGGYDTLKNGRMTAAVGVNQFEIGFGRSSGYGSCTLDDVWDMTDNNEGHPLGTGLFFSQHLGAYPKSIVASRFKLTIPTLGFTTSGFGIISPVNASTNEYTDCIFHPINFTVRKHLAKLGDVLGDMVVSSVAAVYPYIATPEDVAWVLDGSNSEVRSISFTETHQTPGAFQSEPNGLAPIAGFEVGKTYDFTLEYKIDAIITEDGVQTF